ncbi:MAG: hypothetical protein RIS00_22 [Pseudomonadota bacterium]|jgi:hypothetical protein
MDNILKYILGVLGVAALIALAIPENAGKPKDDPSTLKPIAPAPIASTNGPIPPATTDEADSGDDAMEDWEDDYRSFGQPMNDAQPAGSEGNSSNSENVASPGSIPIGPAGSPSIASGNSETGQVSE